MPAEPIAAPVRLAVVGAGVRGTIYTSWAREHPDRATIVAVVDPRDAHRERMATAFNVPPERVLADWRELAAMPRIADGVILATPDNEHAEPAIAFAGGGYHLLLEKPMAPTERDCRRIVESVGRSGVLLAVCHVLRYTRYTEQLKALVDDGRIGEIVSVQHLEPVGWWHQAHSFVRGNWRSTQDSSPMLLAKSCHDLDWIRYIAGQPFRRVSSFGGLQHFRPEHRPPGAADRCLECPVEPDCAYSAVRIYLGRVQRGETDWPVDVLVADPTTESVTAALRTGPYGRCVYAGDNDVVDHQVVGMEFANGASGVFSMTGFTRQRDRETRLFGTRGELHGDGSTITVHDFLTDRTEVIRVDQVSDGSILTGHGGGDERLMEAFVDAVATGNAGRIRSGAKESLETHLAVFAAERARLEGRVVEVDPA